jgi:quinol---cytochrome c reductase iron-sulfur subunit, bacillus type
MNGNTVSITEVAPFPEEQRKNKWTTQSEQEAVAPAANVISKERRSVLGFLTGLIGLGITSLLATTLGRYTVAPALAASGVSDWVDVAPLAAIPNDKPKNQIVLVSQNAGWGRFTSEQSVWVIKRGEQVKVFSAVCPHLGCTISQKSNGFGCVCHNSTWTPEGETSGGPAPRGMDLLEHKVEDGILKVKYQTFKQGLSEKTLTS